MGIFDFFKKTNSKANDSQMSKVIALVSNCQKLESSGRIPELQNALFELYSHFNKPGSGRLIIDYPNKLDLGLCFAFLLKYDWEHNPGVREVWAEDGFYCFMEYLDHQSGGRQGQAQGFLLFFALLCVGRDSLKPKFQDILNKAQIVGNPVFHPDDYKLGAQNIIDQISLLCTSGMRDLGQEAIPVVAKVLEKFGGLAYFEQTIHRTDLMKYAPKSIIDKERFIARVIESVLNDF